MMTPGGLTAYRFALQFGLIDVADLLCERTGAEALPDDERFVAACTSGNESEARRMDRAARFWRQRIRHTVMGVLQ
jgi:hypothetical protein